MHSHGRFSQLSLCPLMLLLFFVYKLHIFAAYGDLIYGRRKIIECLMKQLIAFFSSRTLRRVEKPTTKGELCLIRKRSLTRCRVKNTKSFRNTLAAQSQVPHCLLCKFSSIFESSQYSRAFHCSTLRAA